MSSSTSTPTPANMQKYYARPDNLKSILNEYGVAIIPSVLNNDECQQMNIDMWNYLEHITANMSVPINRAQPDTWSTYKQLYPKHSMLLQQWGIGQSQLVWNVRQNPNVISPFEIIWDTQANDMLSSFDGASFHFPPEKYGTGHQGWFRQLWMHTDQSYTRSVHTQAAGSIDPKTGNVVKEPIFQAVDNMECIQSWVTANDVNLGDATLAFLEGSHKLHGKFAVEHNITSNSKDHQDNWYKLNQDELKWYRETNKCPLVHINCKAGDMVLWDSRTIHCGVEPTCGRVNGANIRNVVYACYVPRRLATPQVLSKRIKAHEELRTTNHWPHHPKLFPKHPRTYGGKLPSVQDPPKPILSKLGRRLVGYDA